MNTLYDIIVSSITLYIVATLIYAAILFIFNVTAISFEFILSTKISSSEDDYFAFILDN